MTDMAADVVGVIGSIIILGAFIYANRAPVLDKRLFNAANLVGAILLVMSLSVHFNLAALILEVIWGLIALAELVADWRRRRQPEL